MTETVRRRGRPRGAAHERLDEFELAEVAEAQLKAFIDRRANEVARSSTRDGYQTLAQLERAEDRRKERAEQLRIRWEWVRSLRRLAIIFRAQADDATRRADELEASLEAGQL